MRTFHLDRQEDETGVSGTGLVAEGIQFEDGTVAIRWMTETASTGVYASIDDVEVIHGHSGKTVIRWDDDGNVYDDPYRDYRKRLEDRIIKFLDEDGFEAKVGRCQHYIPLVRGQNAEGDLNVVIEVRLRADYRSELQDVRDRLSELFRRIGPVHLRMDPDHYADAYIWPVACDPHPEGFQTFTIHLSDQDPPE